MKYSILIQWSEKDRAYIASLPEWGKYARTHGETYEEAFENAKEVLEDLVYAYNQMGKPLPALNEQELVIQFTEGGLVTIDEL